VTECVQKGTAQSKLKRALSLLRWAAVILTTIAAVALFIEMVIGQRMTEEDIQQFVKGAGIYAPILFVAVFAVAGSLVVPTTILAIVGATLFGRGLGCTYSMIGAELAALLGFMVARTLGRQSVERWIGRQPGKLARIDKRLAERGFSTAVIMRLVYLPNGLINVVCGVSGMPAVTYGFATAIGLFPIVFAVTFLTAGAKAAILGGDWSALLEPETVFAIVLFVVCVTGPIAVGALKRRVRTRGLLRAPLDEVDAAFTPSDEQAGSDS